MRKLTTFNTIENDFTLWPSYLLPVKLAQLLTHYSDKELQQIHTPPNCENVFGTWKLKRDQDLCPSGTNIDPIFPQHTHPANTSVSPG